MLIVDGQVHIWAASTPQRPWPARHAPHWPVPLGADDLIKEMAVAGVNRAVLVPPSWEGERNDLVIEEIPWLKGGDLEWVMGKGICEWLGWK